MIRTAPGAGAGGRRRPQCGPTQAQHRVLPLPSHRGVKPPSWTLRSIVVTELAWPSSCSGWVYPNVGCPCSTFIIKNGCLNVPSIYPALEPQSGASIGLLARGETIGHHHIGTHTGRHRPLRHRTGNGS